MGKHGVRWIQAKTKLRLLGLLEKREGETTRGIVRILKLKPHVVCRGLKYLEENGFIYHKPGKQRRKHWFLKPKGRKLLKELMLSNLKKEWLKPLRYLRLSESFKPVRKTLKEIGREAEENKVSMETVRRVMGIIETINPGPRESKDEVIREIKQALWDMPLGYAIKLLGKVGNEIGRAEFKAILEDREARKVFLNELRTNPENALRRSFLAYHREEEPTSECPECGKRLIPRGEGLICRSCGYEPQTISILREIPWRKRN